MELDFTLPTELSFEDAVAAVQSVAPEHGFTVGFVHEMSETLESKGFPREPISIVELCNAKHASAVLAQDVKIGLMLPCPVLVYQQDGSVFVSTMRPSLIAGFYPHADVADTAAAAEEAIFAIVREAAAG